jgi:hypothetical protein
MMKLSDKQLKFVRSRRKLIGYRNYIVVFLSSIFAAFVVWMYYKAPLLVNPYEVISKLENSTLEKDTMILMAGMLPIMVLVALFLLGGFIIFLIIAMSNEARYIEIIDHIIDGKQEKPEKNGD